MKAPSKKLLFAVMVCSLVLMGGLMTGSESSVGALTENAELEASTVAVMAAIQAELPWPPLFASAWFTGTWCYIDCGNGSYNTVRAWSTSGCCDACADFCGDTCVAEGGGPSVLCDPTH